MQQVTKMVWDPRGASLLEPPSLDREALFELQVELAEAAINRLQPSQPASRERNASADEAQAPFDAPSSGTPRGAPPTPHHPATPSQRTTPPLRRQR